VVDRSAVTGAVSVLPGRVNVEAAEFLTARHKLIKVPGGVGAAGMPFLLPLLALQRLGKFQGPLGGNFVPLVPALDKPALEVDVGDASQFLEAGGVVPAHPLWKVANRCTTG
jgi:hypothetical protein